MREWIFLKTSKRVWLTGSSPSHGVSRGLHLNFFTLERPRSGCLKANFDGSLNSETILQGFGFLIRDTTGHLCIARAKPTFGLSINIVEFSMVYVEIKCAVQVLKATHLWVEGDSMVVVNRLNHWNLLSAIVDAMLGHIRAWVAVINSWRVTHIFIEGNSLVG